MKRRLFSYQDVLWGTSKEKFESTQKELDKFGAKAIILPDEILNYKPTEEDLILLGLKKEKENELEK